MNVALWRVLIDGRPSLARGPWNVGPSELLDLPGDIDALLSGDGYLDQALEAPAAGSVPTTAKILAPLAGQEVWASGVTFDRSRAARNSESRVQNVHASHYDLVYSAERPELFFKSTFDRVRGPGDPVTIRSDSGWDVPEPELGLVASASGRIVAYTLGNDVSSRSIEGENPLYLPQAKVYEGSCSIGPSLVPVDQAPSWKELVIELEIHREGNLLFTDSLPLTEMRRTTEELIDWLFRGMRFPRGVVLLTGTSIIPALEFTLRDKDEVTIRVAGIGALHNRVEVLDARSPRALAKEGR